MNWKTSLTGFVTAICYLVYKYFTHTLSGDDVIIAAGMAGVGHLAKDKDVTGGSRHE